MKTQDTTKEAVGKRMHAIADAANAANKDDKAKRVEWHSQKVHKAAVCQFFLDLLEVKDAKQRAEVAKHWEATPDSFGCNASAMAQALGRESKKEATVNLFANL